MKKVIFGIALAVLIGMMSQFAAAQARQRLSFPRGSTGTAVAGSVRGFAYHDYIIRISRGQELEVNLVTNGSPSVFTISGPGGGELSGATEANDYDGAVPASGDYRIRVMMMRSAARRPGSVSKYTLKVSAH